MPAAGLEKTLIGGAVAKREERDRLTLGDDQDQPAEHVVQAEGGDERGEPGIDHDRSDAGAERNADDHGCENAEERIEASLDQEPSHAEKPIVAGKARSISPTVTTKTRGTTRKSATGKVTRTAL